MLLPSSKQGAISLPLPLSICWWLRRVRSQGGLRAGTSLSSAAGLASAAAPGPMLNAPALSLHPDADDFAFPPPLCHTIIPFCSMRAESQLCPVNLNLWHTYSGRTYCCTSYKGISFSKRQCGSAGKRFPAVFV